MVFLVDHPQHGFNCGSKLYILSLNFNLRHSTFKKKVGPTYFRYNENLSTTVGKDKVFLRLAWLLLGLHPQEIGLSSPASPWKTPSSPLLLRLAQFGPIWGEHRVLQKNLLNIFLSFLKIIPISSEQYMVRGRRPRTIYSTGNWYNL